MDEFTLKWISRAIKDHLSEETNITNNAPLVFHCGICGDKATGKHYGAQSCDGCKGFFRRSVRNNSTYSCRFARHCVIDKDKRNTCRYCRLQKCFRVGMKIHAVQNERDKIGPHRRSSNPHTTDHNDLSVGALKQTELGSKDCRSNRPKNGDINVGKRKFASLADIYESIKSQLLSLVHWAKRIPLFDDLSNDDQVALLKANCIRHWILALGWRSVNLEDVLLIDNEFIILKSITKARDTVDPDVHNIGVRIIDEVVKPLSSSQADFSEFVCLKAIVFFDPNAYELKDRERIKGVRCRIQMNMQDHVSDQQYNFRGRFGELLLILPALHEISLHLVSLLHETNLLEESEIVSLVREMLLSATHDKQINGTKNKTIDDGSSDSSATISSPNSPVAYFHEHVTIKVEPDLELDNS